MTRKPAWILPLITILSTAIAYGQCPELERRPSKELIAYLESHRVDRSPAECICQAIKQLGIEQSAAGIPVLTDYLNYKRPISEADRSGIVTRIPSIPRMYPATDALFAIGQPAVPALLKVLQDHDTSKEKRGNALFTLMQIYRDNMPAAISMLKLQAATLSNEDSAAQLLSAARDAVRWCDPDHRAACSAALTP